jgi:hypothetical protein
MEAHASQGKMVDLDSDVAPELVQGFSVKAVWINRDGDRWPEDIRYSRNEYNAKDQNSDGNPEIKERSSMNVNFVDRNNDRYPELVRIEYARTTYIDRDSDGRIDQIRFLRKLFLWIDRDSDGIPERFVRSSVEEIRAPSTDDEVGTLPERKRLDMTDERDPDGSGTDEGAGDITDEKEPERQRTEDQEEKDTKEPSLDDTARIDRQKI